MNNAYSCFFSFIFIIVLVSGCGQQPNQEADENYDPESKLRELQIKNSSLNEEKTFLIEKVREKERDIAELKVSLDKSRSAIMETQ